MPNGAEYPEAHCVAVALFEEDVIRREMRMGSRLNRAECELLRREMVPPYPVSSFPNRWWKLRRDFLSRTLERFRITHDRTL